MPTPASRASRAERKRTSAPSRRMTPRYSACTPAMIFISVLLPAPFSPTSPWISPLRKAKSTLLSASTPPNALETPASSSKADEDGNARSPGYARSPGSDQVVPFHPHHAGRVVLGDDRTVGDDMLGDAAVARLLAVHHRRDAGQYGAAMDAAGGIADRGMHASVQHRIESRRHGVHPADQDVGAVRLFHHVVGGQRHVVVVEESGIDLRILGQQGLPDPRHLGHVPI